MRTDGAALDAGCKPLYHAVAADGGDLQGQGHDVQLADNLQDVHGIHQHQLHQSQQTGGLPAIMDTPLTISVCLPLTTSVCLPLTICQLSTDLDGQPSVSLPLTICVSLPLTISIFHSRGIWSDLNEWLFFDFCLTNAQGMMRQFELHLSSSSSLAQW